MTSQWKNISSIGTIIFASHYPFSTGNRLTFLWEENFLGLAQRKYQDDSENDEVTSGYSIPPFCSLACPEVFGSSGLVTKGFMHGGQGRALIPPSWVGRTLTMEIQRLETFLLEWEKSCATRENILGGGTWKTTLLVRAPLCTLPSVSQEHRLLEWGTLMVLSHSNQATKHLSILLISGNSYRQPSCRP